MLKTDLGDQNGQKGDKKCHEKGDKKGDKTGDKKGNKTGDKRGDKEGAKKGDKKGGKKVVGNVTGQKAKDIVRPIICNCRSCFDGSDK